MLRQRRLRASEQVRQQFARPIQAGENRDAAAFDLLEQDRARPAFELGGDGRELVGRIDLGAHANQPSPAVEPIDDSAKIGDDRYAGSIPGHAFSSYAAPLFFDPVSALTVERTPASVLFVRPSILEIVKIVAVVGA